MALRAVQVNEPGGDFELVQREVPTPGYQTESLARDLGAHHYIDSTGGDPGEALMGLGAADVILSTVTSADASGTARDSEDALNFSVLSGVRPMIETVPLERAAEAYENMTRGEARFRMLITTGAS